jgi:hypothetical protein
VTTSDGKIHLVPVSFFPSPTVEKLRAFGMTYEAGTVVGMNFYYNDDLGEYVELPNDFFIKMMGSQMNIIRKIQIDFPDAPDNAEQEIE